MSHPSAAPPARLTATAYVGVLFAVVAWGASFVATKHVVAEVSPETVIFLRFGIGAVVLGIATARRGQMKWLRSKDLGLFALLGFLGIGFHQWLQATGLLTAQATTAAWIVTATPIWTAMLGRLLLGERLGWGRVAGIAVAAFGVLLVLARGSLGPLLGGTFFTQGDLLMLLSSPNWAIVTVLTRRALGEHPAARLTFWVMTLGWLMTAIWLFAVGPGFSEIPQLSASGWGAILFLGVGCSGLAYIGWYDALAVLPAARVSAFLYLEPPIAMMLAALLGQEPWSLAPLFGGTVIVLGVVMVNRRWSTPRAPLD